MLLNITTQKHCFNLIKTPWVQIDTFNNFTQRDNKTKVVWKIGKVSTELK